MASRGNNGESHSGRAEKWLSIVAALVAILGFFGIATYTDLIPSGPGSPEPTRVTPYTPPPGTTTPQVDDLSSRRAAYIREADAVCRQHYEETARVTNTMPENSLRMERYRQIYESMLTNWQVVTPPPEDVRTVNALLDNGHRAEAVMDDEVAAYAQEDVQQLKVLGDRLDGIMENNRRASIDYGLRFCY